MSTWDVIDNDHLDASLLQGASDVIQAWFEPGTPTVVSPAVLRWKLGDTNPAGPGFLTVAVRDGEVVGAISATLRRFRWQRRDVVVAEMGDIYTAKGILRESRATVPWDGDPDHYLSKSVFGRIATETFARSDPRGIAFYYGVSNEAAFRTWVRHLDFTPWMGQPLRSHSRPGAAALGERAGRLGPLAVVAERGHALVLEGATALRHGLRVHEVTGEEAAVHADALWERVRDREELQPLRDGAWIRFRYLAHPEAEYRYWHARGFRGQAVIVTRAHRDSLGRSVVQLADVVADGVGDPITTAFALLPRRAGSRTTQLYSTWAQRPWSRFASTTLGLATVHEDRLITRPNPLGSEPAPSVPSLGLTYGTSDHV